MKYNHIISVVVLMAMTFATSCSTEDIELFDKLSSHGSPTLNRASESGDADYTFTNRRLIWGNLSTTLECIVPYGENSYRVNNVNIEGDTLLVDDNLPVDDFDNVIVFNSERSDDPTVKLFSYKNIKIRFGQSEMGLAVKEYGELKFVEAGYDGAANIDESFLYLEMTAKFTQDIIFNPFADGTEEIPIRVEYIVRFDGKQQVGKIEKVKYAPYVELKPSHDNIPNAIWISVVRDRIYSNGVTVSDTFYNYGISTARKYDSLRGDIDVFGPRTFVDDKHWYRCKTEHWSGARFDSDIEDYEYDTTSYLEFNGKSIEALYIPEDGIHIDYKDYSPCKLYDIPKFADASESIDVSDTPYPKTTMELEPGFYFKSRFAFGGFYDMCMNYGSIDDYNPDNYLITYTNPINPGVHWTDCFFIMDGRIINFDIGIKDLVTSHMVEDYTSPEGYKGITATIDFQFTQLGRKYHAVNRVHAYAVHDE